MSLTSAAIAPAVRSVPRAASRPVRAATCAAVLAATAVGCVLALGHATGALHVPAFHVHARLGALFLAPSLLALFLPLTLAVRQHLTGRRALPLLLLAALGPFGVLEVFGITVLPWMFCIGCSTIH
jgi:hypothetical protein